MTPDLDSIEYFQELITNLDKREPTTFNSKGKSLRQAWHQATDSSHLLWLAPRIGISDSLVRLAACNCVRHVVDVHKVPISSELQDVITIVEKYTQGEESPNKLRQVQNSITPLYKSDNLTDPSLHIAVYNLCTRDKRNLWPTASYALASLMNALHPPGDLTYTSLYKELMIETAEIVRERIPFESLVLPIMSYLPISIAIEEHYTYLYSLLNHGIIQDTGLITIEEVVRYPLE